MSAVCRCPPSCLIGCLPHMLELKQQDFVMQRPLCFHPHSCCTCCCSQACLAVGEMSRISQAFAEDRRVLVSRLERPPDRWVSARIWRAATAQWLPPAAAGARPPGPAPGQQLLWRCRPSTTARSQNCTCERENRKHKMHSSSVTAKDAFF
jgi:hypothetical protein